ncbi:hypothetical protein BO70DRAFT_426346 [Aspergillus heteromorphus CBS 117.55]|uniref:N-acetyltransferase domain-containing protein n=1 Tax=Aspergillus heteromorphus CBS 117.55 TaxID=1448321 RepID=A0A317WUA1_9EURO|nr:uncharacterized protein BO70DRAFT_426346 [Aspergillus heteromorphus CBS 117.55]PWY89936.1 hypothetical protein BO70DRAFT_426346 [Aspergillus heteromorphus CBS 117.55]
MNTVPPILTPRLTLTTLTISDAADLYDIRGRDEVMKWSVKGSPDATLEETTAWLARFIAEELTADFGPRVGFAVRERFPSPSTPSSSSLSPSPSTSPPPPPPPPPSTIPPGKMIGMLGIRLEPYTSSFCPATQAASGKDRWEIGYIMHPDAWGKGYASEAVGAAVGAWFAGIVGSEGIQRGYVGARGEDGVVEDGVWAMVNGENGGSIRVLGKCGFVGRGGEGEGEPEVVREGDGRVSLVFWRGK